MISIMDARGFSFLFGILALSACADGFLLKDVSNTEMQHFTAVSIEPINKEELLVHELLGSLVKEYAMGNDDVNPDDFVKDVMNTLQEYFRDNKEPWILGERGDFKSINITGLSTIYKTDKLETKDVGGKMIIQIHLGFGNLTGQAYLDKKLFGNIRATGTGTAKVEHLKMSVELEVEMLSKIKAKLLELKITDWGNLVVDFKGDSAIGKLIESIIKQYPELFKGLLKGMLPGVIKKGISDVLEKYHGY